MVERVRMGLGKNFTNRDLDHFLKMSQKYQIPVNLLCISGYLTETYEEFELSKQWFRDRKEYVDNSVSGIQLTPLSVLPGTELNQKMNTAGFITAQSKKVNKYQELSDAITESGFRLVDYSLMERPD